MPTDYATDPKWADVVPLPLDEGGPNPLAAIAYAEDYVQTTAYLRAVMAANELSPRALELTTELIDLNPAHYTVWLYRARILAALSESAASASANGPTAESSDDQEGGKRDLLEEELMWLNETALANQKNYQIWHHRQMIVERRGSIEGEREFICEMLDKDAKNYHVWSYRQWLVRRFGLWEGEDSNDETVATDEQNKDGKETGEMRFTRDMIAEDGRNNSAWNHRWFVLHGREGKSGVSGGSGGVRDARIRERELKLAMEEIEKAPGNACPWNYLRGIVKVSGMGWTDLKGFVAKFAKLDVQPEEVISSYALDLLAEILAVEGHTAEAKKALDLLAEKYDPIRKGYWSYRKAMLTTTPSEPAAGAAAAA